MDSAKKFKPYMKEKRTFLILRSSLIMKVFTHVLTINAIFITIITNVNQSFSKKLLSEEKCPPYPKALFYEELS